MLEKYSFLATIRKNLGTNYNKKLKKAQNQIPAIIYIKNQNSLHICIDHDKFYCFLKEKKNYKENIKIIIENEFYLVKIKDIQNHQYKSTILHIDFKKI